MELQGVAALVTGGAHRVGRAVVMALAEAGCDLVLHYNSSAEEAEQTAEEVRAMGRQVRLVGADLSDPSTASEIVAGAGDLSPVRVLVNSAAMFPRDTVTDVSSDGWDRTMAVNLRAPVFLTQAFAQALPVNAVALGAMLPPPGEDSAYLKELAQEIPLQRVGGTEPVARAVLFLLQSDFVTGETVRLNGGAHLR
jgi:glucose 1-dehydrogenase